jgi:hypothetical protein
MVGSWAAAEWSSALLPLQIIPAENLVAAFQSSQAEVLATCRSASDARLMLGALELGTSGIVLETEDPSEVTTEPDTRNSPCLYHSPAPFCFMRNHVPAPTGSVCLWAILWQVRALSSFLRERSFEGSKIELEVTLRLFCIAA